MMLNKSNIKWFDNRAILILLFFVFPPLGIYGILQHKTHIWKKVIYILPFVAILFSIIVALNSDYYEIGIKHYKKKEYLNAYNNLKLVSANDKNYIDATKKINEIKPIVDSIRKIEETRGLDEKKEAKSDVTSDEKNDINNQLEREINSIKKEDYVFAKGNTVSELQMDLVLLGAYWKIIHDGENSGDTEAKKLANELKEKVVKIQSRAYPKLRKKYIEVAKGLLWEHDIDVYSSDGGKVMNLTAGIFASNGNIKSTEEIIEENMKLFRFKQVRYRWYKGDDEFTYYDLKPLKDTDPVTF